MPKEDFYNRSYYDKTYNDEFADRQQQWLEDYLAGKYSPFIGRVEPVVASLKKFAAGKTILDLGCGVGTFAIVLGRMDYQVCGVDLSGEAIKKCEFNKTAYNAVNAVFLKKDICENIFNDQEFDAIIAADIIEHLPKNKLRLALGNCYRWLKPGGILIIHTFPTKYYYQTLGRTAVLLYPLFLLPAKLDNIYLWLLDKLFFNPWWILRRGLSHTKEVAESGHCNPPHPLKFDKLLERAGFNIVEKKLLDEPLSDLDTDRPRNQTVKRLIAKKKMLKPDIYLVAKK